jgi:segregation and condensation protein B
VTTKTFLEAFGLASLRDLPDLERLRAEGALQGGQGEEDLDSALGLNDDRQETYDESIFLNGEMMK